MTTVSEPANRKRGNAARAVPIPNRLQHLPCQKQLGNQRDETHVAVKLPEENGKGVFRNEGRLRNRFHLPCGYRRND